MQTHEFRERRSVQLAKARKARLVIAGIEGRLRLNRSERYYNRARCRQSIRSMLPCRPALRGFQCRTCCPRSFADKVVLGANHPFTMTLNPAVQSTKKYTSQVPLYHSSLVMPVGMAVAAVELGRPCARVV